MISLYNVIIDTVRTQVSQKKSKLKIIPTKNINRAPLFVVALHIHFEFLLYGMLIAWDTNILIVMFFTGILIILTSYKTLVKVFFPC